MKKALAEAVAPHLDAVDEAWAGIEADHISGPCYERLKAARERIEAALAAWEGRGKR